jgi:hypothetical protein
MMRAFAVARSTTGRRLQPLLHVPWKRLGIEPHGAAKLKRIWLLERSNEAGVITKDRIIEVLNGHMRSHDAAYGDPFGPFVGELQFADLLRSALSDVSLHAGTMDDWTAATKAGRSARQV